MQLITLIPDSSLRCMGRQLTVGRRGGEVASRGCLPWKFWKLSWFSPFTMIALRTAGQVWMSPPKKLLREYYFGSLGLAYKHFALLASNCCSWPLHCPLVLKIQLSMPWNKCFPWSGRTANPLSHTPMISKVPTPFLSSSLPSLLSSKIYCHIAHRFRLFSILSKPILHVPVNDLMVYHPPSSHFCFCLAHVLPCGVKHLRQSRRNKIFDSCGF